MEANIYITTNDVDNQTITGESAGTICGVNTIRVSLQVGEIVVDLEAPANINKSLDDLCGKVAVCVQLYREGISKGRKKIDLLIQILENLIKVEGFRGICLDLPYYIQDSQRQPIVELYKYNGE